MDSLDKCLLTLKNAKSDTEKFAALLFVAKSLKSNELTSEQRNAIFEAIGLNFIRRLLRTTDVPEGCPPFIFKSVAFAVLSVFTTDAELFAQGETLAQILEVMKHVLDRNSEESNEDLIIDDVFLCLQNLTQNSECSLAITTCGFLDTLTDIYVSGRHGHEKAFQIMINAIQKAPRGTLCGEWFLPLVTKLSTEFKEDQSLEKFEICRTLTGIIRHCRLTTQSMDTDSGVNREWWSNVYLALSDILRSKLTDSFRNSALQLVSALFETYGGAWLISENQQVQELFCLIVNLTSIEIQVILGSSIDNILSANNLLSCCYSIMEHSITIVSSDSLMLVRTSRIEQLLNCLQITFSVIFSFLSDVSLNWNNYSSCEGNVYHGIQEVTFATIRVLAAWLAEETSTLHKDIIKVFPFILQLSKDLFESHKHEDDMELDLIQFLIPAMCHFTADDALRKVLLEANFHHVLFEYLQYQWKKISGKFDCEEPEARVETACGIFLNVVVLEQKLVSESEFFFSLFKYLMKCMPCVPDNVKHLTLKANFAVLGLFLAKLHSRRLRSCESVFYRFLSSSVKFLWDAHSIETGRNEDSFSLVLEYKKVWPDIIELWFLGMQVLCNLLTILPWVAQFLLESGWPQHVIRSFAKISDEAIEGSVRSAYQEFLCCVVRTCPEASSQLKECGAISVCRTLKLKELHSLIETGRV